MALTAKKLVSKTFRKLGTINVPIGGGLQILQLPCDAIFRAFILVLRGGVTATFGSGTPLANYRGAFDNICPLINVRLPGELVKSISPFMLQQQNFIAKKIQGWRSGSAGAALAAQSWPQTYPSGFTYAATTNISSYREVVVMPFEYIYSDKRENRDLTLLNLSRVPNAQLEFNFVPFNSNVGLIAEGNTAPVTFSNSTFVVDVLGVEANEYNPMTDVFAMWRQTQTQDSIGTAAVTNRQVNLNRGAYFAGLLAHFRNGAAGSATTATGRLPDNTLASDMSLKYNGNNVLIDGDYNLLFAHMKDSYGIWAPQTAGLGYLDGTVKMDLCSDADPRTAFDARKENQIDTLYLNYSTNSGATYTNGATVDLVMDEIVPAA